MRKLASGFTLIAVAALAACSGGSKEEAAPTVIKLSPGLWEMTYEVTEMKMQGVPPDAMKANSKVTRKLCLTKEQVENPDASMFSSSNGGCKYDSFYMARGRLNSTMSCTQPGMDGNVVVSVDGNYTADSIDVTSELNTRVAGAGDMRVKSKTSGKRIGDECPAEAAPTDTKA